MAYNLDLTRARAWPDVLARPVDIDGAFRFAAILAAHRVIAPVKPGDGFARHFDSDIHPPDFATADKYAAAAYRAMAALFAWDGGTSGVGAHSPDPELGWCEFAAVTRGERVFIDVMTRGAIVSASPYEIESAARLGEVNSCLASEFPYRYWWSAYNRACHQLMHDWPLGGIANAKWMPDYVDDESSVAEAYIDLNILPYSFAKTPSGAHAITVDDLLTYWMSHADAAELRKVAEGDMWLATAEDIDFSGVFWRTQSDERNNWLRAVWLALAHEVGFTNYASVGVAQRWGWLDAMPGFWRGATTPKYADDLLAQLETDWAGYAGDWRGGRGPWRDEFPYHGFAAQLAYLDYFEQHNVGFAIESAGLDVMPTVKPKVVVNTLTAETEEMEFALSLDTDFTIELSGFNEPVLERTEPDEDPEEPYAHASRLAPTVDNSFTAEIATNLLVAWVGYGGALNEWTVEGTAPGEPFWDYMESGNVAALGAALNRMALGNISSITARGRFNWSSSARTVRPPDDLDENPLARDLWDVLESDRPVMFDNGRDSTVYFLRTTNSCRICRALNHALRSQLMAEADVPASGDLEPLTLGDNKVSATFKTLTGDLIIASADPTRTIKIYNSFTGEYVERPMPIISKRTGDGSYSQVFPSAAMESVPEAGYGDEYITVGSFSPELEIEIDDTNEYETFSHTAQLQMLRSLTFVRFPERRLAN